MRIYKNYLLKKVKIIKANIERNRTEDIPATGTASALKYSKEKF